LLAGVASDLKGVRGKMRQINPYSHIPFLHAGLMRLLPKDSFSLRMRRAIGDEIDAMLEPDEEFGERGNFSSSFPVQSLFLWITSNKEGLVLDWLSNEDGNYFDDNGELIPPTVAPSLPGVEQLAAYGLWFLDVEMASCGPYSEEDYDDNRINPDGWKESEVLDHKAECLLNAYQALVYAERLIHGTKLSAEETERAAQFDFSAIGKDGAEKRHAPMKALRAWAIAKYRAGKWPSANQAAHDLKASVIAHGNTINAKLTEQNAQRTIANWFSKSV
jgi:hypothetical protein